MANLRKKKTTPRCCPSRGNILLNSALHAPPQLPRPRYLTYGGHTLLPLSGEKKAGTPRGNISNVRQEPGCGAQVGKASVFNDLRQNQRHTNNYLSVKVLHILEKSPSSYEAAFKLTLSAV